jgi:hypothetical protein
MHTVHLQNNQKGSILMYLLIGVLIIVAIGGVYYFYGQSNTPVNSLATPPRT